jgi:hypothetical protein
MPGSHRPRYLDSLRLLRPPCREEGIIRLFKAQVGRRFGRAGNKKKEAAKAAVVFED